VCIQQFGLRSFEPVDIFLPVFYWLFIAFFLLRMLYPHPLKLAPRRSEGFFLPAGRRFYFFLALCGLVVYICYSFKLEVHRNGDCYVDCR